MDAYDTRLQRLQEQIARFKKLVSVTEELRRQREAFSARAEELEAVMLDEQADVDRLEGRSLAAFFYNVIGRMDEKLDRERQEAYEARVRYDAAARELAETEELFENPLHPYTKALISAIPIPDPSIERRRKLQIFQKEDFNPNGELREVSLSHFVLENS